MGSFNQKVVEYFGATPISVGSILYWDGNDWIALSPGNDGETLETQGSGSPPIWVPKEIKIGIAASDEITDLEVGVDKAVFRVPTAMTLTDVRASVTTAPVGSTIIIDVNKNGSTIFSTKLSIDAGEKTSETASVPAVISVSSFSDDDEITVDIDQIGSTTAGTGLKIWVIGKES